MYQWVAAIVETHPDASAYVRLARHILAIIDSTKTSNVVSLRYGFGNPKRIAPHDQPRCGRD